MDKLTAMTEQVRDFCDARDWRKYHTPKELAIGMATEASELLQLFPLYERRAHCRNVR